MRVFKLSFLFLSAALFIAGCNKSDVADRIYNQPNQAYEIGRVEEGFLEDDELIGRENLDLQALGALMERANNAEDFEYLLNSDDGINNLDLNDDGYADYISVREFGDNYDDERGFSLYSMFGNNLIQEIAQIIFDRDRYNDGYNDGYYPGSRVLIRGNDYLYGDDYYYESNWNDRQVPFVDWVFSERDNYYQSPYYYQNYPSYYEPYQVVQTPVYLTRIEQYYYSPVFVQTAQPSVTEIKVVSPYSDVSLSQAYMKVPEEQRVQRQQKVILERNNQRTAQVDRERPGKTNDFSVKENNQDFSVKEDKRVNDNPNRAAKQDKVINERQQQVRDQIRETREKPNKPERVDRQPQQKFERQQQKAERQQQQKFERPQQQQKVERQQQRFERQQQQPRPQQQMRVERQQQKRVDRPQQQVNQVRPQQQQRQENRVQPNNGGGNNKGGGNNPAGGGGNKGGGGKGKGKP
jgi:hypothetical protein